MSKKPVLMPKAERREAALQVALKLAKKVGAKRVSIAMVAAAQKVTAPLLFHIFESREGLTKAILKAAKAQGVVLPEAAPTVRELRAATRKTQPKLKALPKLKKPAPVKVKKLAPPKPLPKLKKLAAPKVAALLKPKTTGQKIVDTIEKSRAKLLKQKTAKPASMPTPARKPLTDVQKAAKAARDKARRAPAAAPTTPAGKFASLPKPFEAAIAQVAAAA